MRPAMSWSHSVASTASTYQTQSSEGGREGQTQSNERGREGGREGGSDPVQ